MVYTAPITKQGQVSIPVALRKFLGVTLPGTILFKRTGDTVTIRPAKDIFSLEGILHDSIPKELLNLSTQEAIAQEKKAAIKGHLARYEKSLR